MSPAAATTGNNLLVHNYQTHTCNNSWLQARWGGNLQMPHACICQKRPSCKAAVSGLHRKRFTLQIPPCSID